MSIRPGSPASKGKCHIQNLPAEVLERVFKYLITLSSSGVIYDKEDSGPESSDAVNVTLVCKQWLRPAQRILYKDILVHKPGRAILLQEALHNPILGTFARTVEFGDIFTSSSRRGVWRMLESMPHIEGLAMDTLLLPIFESHPHWEKINRLQLYDCESFQPFLHMLIHLRSLTLSGIPDDDFIRNKPFTLELPNLETLILEELNLSDLGAGLSPAAEPLPSMPNLQTFDVRGGIYDAVGEALVVRMARQFSKSLRSLSIRADKRGQLLLAPYLHKMTHLEHLTYCGTPPALSQEALKPLFPQQLKRLDIEWHGRLSFGLHFLQMLSSSTFLPNLNRCPRLVYHSSGSESLKRLATLTRLAIDTFFGLMTRNELPTVTDLLITVDKSIVSREVVLLPSPHLFMTSLGVHQQMLLDEMCREGYLD